MSDKRRAGSWLLRSAVVAVCLIVLSTCITLNDYLGDGSMMVSGQSYWLSWANGVLGFYAWIAFWVGLMLRSRCRFWQVIQVVMLVLGLVLFIWSGYEEVTRNSWRWE